MIVAGSGHRLGTKLGGYGREIQADLYILARLELENLKPDGVISGMALGWDQALALAALDLGIPLYAAVPFEGQEDTWTPEAQVEYHNILRHATNVIVVTSGRPWNGYIHDPLIMRFLGDPTIAEAMRLRNEWMVDHSHVLVVLFNGEPSGTGNCIKYAKEKKRQVINLWPQWQYAHEQ